MQLDVLFGVLYVQYVKHQARDTAFDHIFKHREELKILRAEDDFYELRGVWNGGQTLSWVYDIFSQSKLNLREKTEKQNRKSLF